MPLAGVDGRPPGHVSILVVAHGTAPPDKNWRTLEGAAGVIGPPHESHYAQPTHQGGPQGYCLCRWSTQAAQPPPLIY